MSSNLPPDPADGDGPGTPPGQTRRRRLLASLTSRLVLTAVLLVATVSLLVGTATTFAMKSYLTGQLDDEVLKSLGRVHTVLTGPSTPAGETPPQFVGQAVGTLTAILTPGVSGGTVVVDRTDDTPDASTLSAADIATLDGVSADGHAHTVYLRDHGTYRVAIRTEGDGVKLVAGLPTANLDQNVNSLVRFELLLALLGVTVAGFVASALVRRQLRDLHEVAATAHSVSRTPLSEGEIRLTDRVPAHLTHSDTEVGQVGAALNTLLAHVETSLEARHRSEQRIRQFVADASHELRTPLTTIVGYTELARQRPDDAEATATALVKVQEESRRMTALVEDLLLLARLDSGRPLERRPVDLTRLLLEAVADARVVAPDHQWRLELPRDAVDVVGDQEGLHQVVTNLLTNARKYTPPGTTVTVVARSDGFFVHDDGPGFPPEVAAHAFERFVRADAARNREGGAGLGLALVQAIVTAHDGRVTLASELGNTTIDVALPRGTTPGPAEPTDNPADDLVPLGLSDNLG